MNVARILCPVDFGRLSHHALEHAMSFAESLRAPVTLLHVDAIPIMALPGGMVSQPAVFVANRSAHQQVGLDSMMKQHARAAVQTENRLVTAQGSIAKTILDFAKDSRSQLIVIGSHGRSAIERLFLGSVAHQVTRDTVRPVLVIPEPEEP